MKNWVNIARKTILLATMLLIGYCYAHAQNTSSEPFVNSWQKYRVSMGAAANSVTWELRKDNKDNLTDKLDLSTLFSEDEKWMDIYSEDDYAAIEIKFASAQGFANGQTWYLVYSEWDGTGGTGNCIAMRSFEIKLEENTFYLSMGGDDDDCNSLHGEVLNWNDINGNDIESYVEFTVQMNRMDDFDMNSWSFSGAISFDQDYDFIRVRSVGDELTGSSNAGEDFTISDDNGSGTFTVSVDAKDITASEPDPLADNDFITLRVFVSGLVYEGETVTLTVSNGKAHSGSTYPKETDDNTNIGGDRIQNNEILPLPATSNIAIID